jgi:hypothetical protein
MFRVTPKACHDKGGARHGGWAIRRVAAVAARVAAVAAALATPSATRSKHSCA